MPAIAAARNCHVDKPGEGPLPTAATGMAVALQVGCDAIIVELCVVGDGRYSSPTCIARSNSTEPDEFLSEHELYAAYPSHTLPRTLAIARSVAPMSAAAIPHLESPG
jgi:hypothetical protein